MLPEQITEHPAVRLLRGQFHRSSRPMRVIELRKRLIGWATRHDCDPTELIHFVMNNPLADSTGKRQTRSLQRQIDDLHSEVETLRAEIAAGRAEPRGEG